MDENVTERIARYAATEEREDFLALRRALAASQDYDPHSEDMELVRDLVKLEQLEAARERLREAMPNRLLSPSAHEVMAYIAHRLGDRQAAESELALRRLMLRGILSTGDGSERFPWLVMYVSDEYDVLREKDKELRQQHLIERGDRKLDMIDCADGTRVWFDVTTPMATESRSGAAG